LLYKNWGLLQFIYAMATERLSTGQVNEFIDQGFIKLENAFTKEIAHECRSLLWKETRCDPGDPAGWTEPVIRIAAMAGEPFRRAANGSLLVNAYDQLAGQGNWLPIVAMGSFPVRFPGNREATDTGWHVDASFPGNDPGNYLDWRINIHSKGRSLLMLFLFSDVGISDAPTRILPGSHFDVARILAPFGEQGLGFTELAQRLDPATGRQEAMALGGAGTVYLCHPFLVHAAQPHHGKDPKFMAQQTLANRHGYEFNKENELRCPVETAIRRALE
jgi:hypothetical protein